MKLHFIYALFLLALFDALFGGALAARLQSLGWDQRVNDLWQIGFAVICALLTVVLSRPNVWAKMTVTQSDLWACIARQTLQDARWQAIYLLAMLLAFAEDLLFYPALWVLNDIGVTSLISDGFDYNFQRFLWPWSISGWFGFVTRWSFGETIKLPVIWAMILSVGTLAGILIHQNYLNAKKGRVS